MGVFILNQRNGTMKWNDGMEWNSGTTYTNNIETQ